MASVIKQSLRQALAESFFNDVFSRRSRFYFFLGKVADFVNGEEPNTTVEYEAKVRNEIVLLNAIQASDVCMVVPRINWESGIVYPEYDVTEEDDDIRNYVMVESTYNVYKCLYNNNGAISVNQPTGTTVDTFQTGDGYIWKFLYNVPLALRTKFLTSQYMPVANSLQSRFFSNGSIESVTILSQGTGYVDATTEITIAGDGTGAILNPVIQNGQLVDVVIVAAGAGYNYATLTVSNTEDGTGTGATAQVNLSNGDVSSLQAIVEMLSIPGTIDSVKLIAPGTGYTLPPTITITGDGTGATATATVLGGQVSDIIITNPGSNYTAANVIITPNVLDTTANGAVAYANFSPPLGHGRNAIEELGAKSVMFFGSITKYNYGGVSIENDYRQFGIIRNPRNLVYGTNINDPVSTYHYAVIADANDLDTADFPIGSTVTRTANTVTTEYIVTSIITGNTKRGLVLYNQTGIPVNVNDIIVKYKNPPTEEIPNPPVIVGGPSFQALETENQQYADAILGSTCYAVQGNFNSADYNSDNVGGVPQVPSVLLKGTSTFLVISKNSNTLLLLPQNSGKISVGDTLNKQGSGLSFTVSNVIEPNIDKNTGQIIFIDNRTAFNQTTDQVLTFRTVINF